MLLEQDLFDELEEYAKLPGESLHLHSFDNLFPQLVFIMLTGIPDFYDDFWEADFRLHVYRSITPIDLVRNTVSRPIRRPSEDSEDWDRWLRRYDAALGELDENPVEGDAEENLTGTSYSREHHVDFLRGITLHKYARLTTGDAFPLSAMAEPLRHDWTIWTEFLIFAPRLDVRHLSLEDPTLNTTLQGCAWTMRQSASQGHALSVAKVDCRLCMIRPLLETVRVVLFSPNI